MNLAYTHKPNYFFFAQTFVRYLEDHLRKHPNQLHLELEGVQVYELFRHDFAATTTNLQAILSIAGAYQVSAQSHTTQQNSQDRIPFILQHHIYADTDRLSLDFHPDAVQAICAGRSLIAPDATHYS